MEKLDIYIRKETDSDREEISKLHKEAFGQEDEATLVDLIRKGANFIPELSIVATVDNVIAGHLLFSKIRIDSSNKNLESLALAPISVLPKFQKKGIGSLLIVHALQKAKKLGFTSVIVLGHEEYYPKFGFAPAVHWNIEAPFKVNDENFMALELVPGSLSEASGTVQYPAEFQAVN